MHRYKTFRVADADCVVARRPSSSGCCRARSLRHYRSGPMNSHPGMDRERRPGRPGTPQGRAIPESLRYLDHRNCGMPRDPGSRIDRSCCTSGDSWDGLLVCGGNCSADQAWLWSLRTAPTWCLFASCSHTIEFPRVGIVPGEGRWRRCRNRTCRSPRAAEASPACEPRSFPQRPSDRNGHRDWLHISLSPANSSVKDCNCASL